MSKTISIIGLGYIGLPLALAASNNGYHVIGLDTDKFKVDQINKGIIKSGQIVPLIIVRDIYLVQALRRTPFDLLRSDQAVF